MWLALAAFISFRVHVPQTTKEDFTVYDVSLFLFVVFRSIHNSIRHNPSLCFPVLPCASLCFPVLPCASLCFTVLHCPSLSFTVLHCTLTINNHVDGHNDVNVLSSPFACD
jgi:hypothetical protein